MIEHVIFDCFGTLIDTGSGSLDAVKTILANVGSDADASKFYTAWKKEKKKMMADEHFFSEKKLFEMSLSKVFDAYGINADASREVKPMTDSLFGVRHVFPDVKATLEMLTRMNIDTAIGSTTDTDSLLHFLKQNDLSFERIYTSEDMRVYKPQKRFYETILITSGWGAEDCLFVGDSYIDDVFGPNSVGMKTVLLDRKKKYAGQIPKPDYLIGSLYELIAIMEGEK